MGDRIRRARRPGCHYEQIVSGLLLVLCSEERLGIGISTHIGSGHGAQDSIVNARWSHCRRENPHGFSRTAVPSRKGGLLWNVAEMKWA